MSWFTDPTGDVRERCKVVIVGAGAGGGFVACTLAEAGIDVVVVERGYHHRNRDFPDSLVDAVGRLYVDGGLRTANGTPPMAVAGGQGLGGSTLVNSAICFRTPRAILDEWNTVTEGAFADVDGFYQAQDAVERLLGVALTPDGLLCGNDQAHKDAADQLGWANHNIRRNTPGCAGCNRCNTGCPVGGKASVDQQLLPRAAAAGARIYTGCGIDHVARGQVSGTTFAPDGSALGEVVIDADIVLLCAGAIATPTLLLNSELVNPDGQVGQGLQIHPNVSAIGLLKQARYKPGATQGHCITEFTDRDLLLEANPILAGGLFQLMPAYGLEGKRLMAMADHFVSGGVMLRDSTRGRVFASPVGSNITYDINEADRRQYIEGMRIAGQLWLEGAHADWVSFSVLGSRMCRTETEVNALLTRDLPVSRIIGYASHPQASCGIGRAIDADGQLTEVPDVYVMDASSLPSNVGRNPQISVMTVARILAERLVARLNGVVQPLNPPELLGDDVQ